MTATNSIFSPHSLASIFVSNDFDFEIPANRNCIQRIYRFFMIFTIM